MQDIRDPIASLADAPSPSAWRAYVIALIVRHRREIRASDIAAQSGWSRKEIRTAIDAAEAVGAIHVIRRADARGHLLCSAAPMEGVTLSAEWIAALAARSIAIPTEMAVGKCAALASLRTPPSAISDAAWKKIATSRYPLSYLASLVRDGEIPAHLLREEEISALAIEPMPEPMPEPATEQPAERTLGDMTEDERAAAWAAAFGKGKDHAIQPQNQLPTANRGGSDWGRTAALRLLGGGR